MAPGRSAVGVGGIERSRRRRDGERTQRRRKGKKMGPTVGSPNRGPLNWVGEGEGGCAEKFGRTAKMAAHLEKLLEINFLHPPSKYGDGSPFSSPAGVALLELL